MTVFFVSIILKHELLIGTQGWGGRAVSDASAAKGSTQYDMIMAVLGLQRFNSEFVTRLVHWKGSKSASLWVSKNY